MVVGFPDALRRFIAGDQDAGDRPADVWRMCVITWAPLPIAQPVIGLDDVGSLLPGVQDIGRLQLSARRELVYPNPR